MRQESRYSMDPHLTEGQVRAYQERSLAPAERIEVSRHLKDCDACRVRLNASVPVPSAIAINKLFAPDTSFSEHLSYEEIVAHIEGKTNPQESAILEDHIRVCSHCKEQVEDLLSFSAYLSTATERTDIPLPPRSFLQRWGQWTAQHPTGLLVWSATPLLVAGLLIVILRYRDAVPANNGHLSRLEQTLNETRAQLAQVEKARVQDKQALAEAIEKNRDVEQKHLKLVQNSQDLNSANKNLHGVINILKTQLTASQAQVERLQQPGLYTDNRGNLAYRHEVAIASGDKTNILTSLQNGLSIPMNDLKSVQPDKTVVLGPSKTPGKVIHLKEPDATLLLSQYPHFAWEAVEQAQRYVLTVKQMNGPQITRIRLEKNGVTWRVTTTTGENPEPSDAAVVPTGNAWQVPDTLLLFREGVTYEWQVKAYASANQEEDPILKSLVGKFQIVDAATRSKMQAAQARYAEAPLVLGIVYASNGLIAEARQQFQKQLQQNPDDQAAQRFLRQLKQKSIRETTSKP